jgi:hypothetical protein
MVSHVNKYDKYVDIVDNFIDSDHYSILFEMEEGENASCFRERLIREFGYNGLLIRRRDNCVHVEKRVI